MYLFTKGKNPGPFIELTILAVFVFVLSFSLALHVHFVLPILIVVSFLQLYSNRTEAGGGGELLQLSVCVFRRSIAGQMLLFVT